MKKIFIAAATAFLCACGGGKEAEAPAEEPRNELETAGPAPAAEPAAPAGYTAALDHELVTKVVFNDAAGAADLLGRGARAGAKDRYGLPVLFIAARGGNADIVGRLIEAGADVNASVGTTHANDGTGYGGTMDGTPLGYAARAGKLDVMERLRAAGADLNGAGPGGNTPLMLAAEGGRWEAVKWLLDNGSAAGREQALEIARRFVNPDENYQKVIKLLAGEPLE